MKLIIKRILRSIFQVLLCICGRELRDCETGERLGKAFIFIYKGKVRIFGLKKLVKVKFLPNKKLSYQYADVGFEDASEPIKFAQKEEIEEKIEAK